MTGRIVMNIVIKTAIIMLIILDSSINLYAKIPDKMADTTIEVNIDNNPTPMISMPAGLNMNINNKYNKIPNIPQDKEIAQTLTMVFIPIISIKKMITI